MKNEPFINAAFDAIEARRLKGFERTVFKKMDMEYPEHSLIDEGCGRVSSLDGEEITESCLYKEIEAAKENLRQEMVESCNAVLKEVSTMSFPGGSEGV